MSVRLLKCYGECEQKYPATQLYKFGSTNYCEKCFEKKEEEKNDRETLYKTIQQIYKIPYPNGQMLRQIKEFKEQRSYNYEGMTKTLCYAVKVLHMNLTLRGALSIIPYYYDSASKYYIDLEEKRNNTGEIKTEVDKVRITPIQHSNEQIIKRKFIDMGGLS